ncbi:unnamed protein product [Protopolystoma xenopodis]|uniref:Uncharacterized protein n=1 Tax=Protopolystoma xenopodis TaxID=117903 RepID=A0A448WCI1_9PLAT|nr:unnamed protein product [Protopolystoma xenopodis]
MRHFHLICGCARHPYTLEEAIRHSNYYAVNLAVSTKLLDILSPFVCVRLKRSLPWMPDVGHPLIICLAPFCSPSSASCRFWCHAGSCVGWGSFASQLNETTTPANEVGEK